MAATLMEGVGDRAELRERAMDRAMETVAESARQLHNKPTPLPRRRAVSSSDAWIEDQGINALRHLRALRPFRREEFGPLAADMPSEGHVQAVNSLLAGLRVELSKRTRRVGEPSKAARVAPSTQNLQSLLRWKEHTHHAVQASEKIWDYYLELFGQRQSRYGTWLSACDRIALDCYQTMFMGLGAAKTIPAPPPWSYMRTGFGPATFRRGIYLRRLGLRNPFPLVQLPYHRLVNPWTLGAILHELSHNLQSDLGLNRAIPEAILRNLAEAGFPKSVVRTWVRWNRETFADMNGLLLGGPAIVASLMDVVGRSPRTVTMYLPRGPHPTPRLRMPLSTRLLRRMGFGDEAAQYERTWERTFPTSQRGNIPAAIWKSFPEAADVVINTICYQPYQQLGGKSLAALSGFAPKHHQMIVEAAGRLARGNDPGVVPERFLIGAARLALDRKLARPGHIARHFYAELAGR